MREGSISPQLRSTIRFCLARASPPPPPRRRCRKTPIRPPLPASDSPLFKEPSWGLVRFPSEPAENAPELPGSEAAAGLFVDHHHGSETAASETGAFQEGEETI